MNNQENQNNNDDHNENANLNDNQGINPHLIRRQAKLPEYAWQMFASFMMAYSQVQEQNAALTTRQGGNNDVQVGPSGMEVEMSLEAETEKETPYTNDLTNSNPDTLRKPPILGMLTNGWNTWKGYSK